MDCAKAKQCLSEYMDGCLSEELSAQLKVHLDSCTQCSAELESYESLRLKLRAVKLENTDDFVWKGIDAAKPPVWQLYKKTWVRSLRAVAACFVLVIGVLAVTQNGAFAPMRNAITPETVQEDVATPDAAVPMKARTADVPYADAHFDIPEGGATTFGSAEAKQKNAAKEETVASQSYSTYSADDAQMDKVEMMPENEKASAGGGSAAVKYTMRIVTISVSAQAREAFFQTLSQLRVKEVDEPTLIAESDLEKLLQIDGVTVTQEIEEETPYLIRKGKIAVEYTFENENRF